MYTTFKISYRNSPDGITTFLLFYDKLSKIILCPKCFFYLFDFTKYNFCLFALNCNKKYLFFYLSYIWKYNKLFILKRLEEIETLTDRELKALRVNSRNVFIAVILPQMDIVFHLAEIFIVFKIYK